MKGTFIQGWLAASYSPAQWTTEINNMKRAGMEYLIIQTTLDGEGTGAPPPQTPTTIHTLYKSAISGTTYRGDAPGTTISPVEQLLAICETKNIKVFVGLNAYEDAWIYKEQGTFTQSSAWCQKEANRGKVVAQELYTQFKASYPNAFYGWYWPYEVDNVRFFSANAKAALVAMMNTFFDGLSNIDATMPIMVSPFYNVTLGTPEAYRDLWIDILAQVPNFGANDILAPQDGMGPFGHATLADLPVWFLQLKKAVKTKPGLLLWTNIETYQQTTKDTDRIPAPLSRVLLQQDATSPHVSKQIGFSYSHYGSPNVMNPAYQVGWEALKTGTISTTPPPAPAAVTAVATGGHVLLSWTATAGVNGDAGFRIFRDGVFMVEILPPKLVRAPVTLMNSTDLNPVGPHPTYRIDAFDVYGNTTSVTVTV